MTLVFPLFGVFIAAVADLLLGSLRPGPGPRDVSGTLVVLGTILGDAATVGLGLGIMLAVVSFLGSRLWLPLPRRFAGKSGRASLASLLVAGAAVAGFLVLNGRLFRGAGVGRQAWAPIAEGGFWIVGSLGIFWLVIRLANFVRALPGHPSRRGAAALTVASLAILAGSLFVNARFYPGQYPDQHLSLVVLGIVAGSLAGAGLSAALRGGRLAGSRATVVATVVIAGMLIIADIGIRSRPESAAHAAPLERFRAAREMGRLANHALDAFNAKGGTVPADGTALDAMRGRVTDPRLLEKWKQRSQPANILWIAMDTVRADHVSCYGYPRKTTPAIDRLAEESVVFEQAWTAYPTSNFAYSAMLNSLPASLTPVHAAITKEKWPCPPEQTLPTLLAKNGYATGAFTGFTAYTAAHAEWFGTQREGFKIYNPDQKDGGAAAPETVDGALRFVEAHRDQPWFLWVHFMEPHDPYVHHPEHDFGNELIDHYDSDLAYTDHQVGRLLEALRENGEFADTIIVVFSDHGEEFLERGGRFHNTSVYEEQIRVPLIVRVPGVAPRRVASAVSLLDVGPTMIELSACADTARRFGRSLVPLLHGAPDPGGGFAFAEWFEIDQARHRLDAFAIRDGTMKLVAKPQRRILEIFDLAADPAESKSLAGTGHPSEARLSSALAFFRDQMKAPAATGAPKNPEPLANPVPSESRALAQAVDDLETGAQGAPELIARIRGLLLDRFSGPRRDLCDQLGENAYRALVNRLADIARRPNFAGRQDLLDLLIFARDPALHPFWMELTGRDDVDKTLCAKALALLGDRWGCDVMADYLKGGHPLLDQDQLNALASLGDARALPDFLLNIQVQKFGRYFRNAIIALPKLRTQLGNPAGWLRDRLVNEGYWHDEISLALLDVLESEVDDDAVVMLLRLGRDQKPEIRTRALGILKRRFDAATLDRFLKATDHELAGDAKALYGGENWPAAVEEYKTALATGPRKNRAAAFGLARALFALERFEEVRAVLAPIKDDDCASANDRARAARYLDLGPFHNSLEPYQASLPSGVKFPERTWTLIPFVVNLEIKNESPTGWRGGWFRWNARIAVHWLNEKDQPVAMPVWRQEETPLPEQGVLAGETVMIRVLGVSPDRRGKFRPILRFESGVDGVENGKVFYRHPTLVEVN